MAAADVIDANYGSGGSRICSLCKENLKQPRLLPCQHSFCTPCLKTIVPEGEATNFMCRTCDFEVSLPPEGVESLPENYIYTIMEQNVKPSPSNRNCTYCEIQSQTRGADLQCLDCEVAVCNSCEGFHTVPSVLRHQRLVSVMELQSGDHKCLPANRKALFCKKHSEGTRQLPLKYYCTDCKTLDCEECILHEEKFFGEESWKALYEEKLETLKKEVDILLNNHKEQTDIVEVIQKVEERIHGKWTSIENKIYDKATEIQELVEKVKNEKLTLVKEHFENELQKCKMMLEKEENQVKRFEFTISFVQDFMKNSSESEYLMYEEDVKTRMSDFMLEREKFEMKTQDLILKGSPTEDLEHSLSDVIGQFGTRTKVTDITGNERGAVMELVIKGKIKLNINARGVTVAENGDIIAVGGSKIEILNKDGESKKVIECKELKYAWSVTVRKDLLFVTDSGKDSKQLLVLDMDGHLKNAIRMPESEQCNTKDYGVGAAVNDRGTIYVCLEGTSAIYTCTLDNTELKLFTSIEQPNLYEPHSLSMTHSGHLVVSSYSSNYIQVYNDQAELLWQYDNKDRPFGVCCNMEGHIFIGCYSKNKICVVKDGVHKGMIEIPGVESSSSLVMNKKGDLLVCHDSKELTKVSLWGL